MRTPITDNKYVEMKAPLKEKGGILIRLPIKKIYCTKCQRLVKGKAQNSGNNTQINCPRCNQNLWSWSHTAWRPDGNK